MEVQGTWVRSVPLGHALSGGNLIDPDEMEAVEQIHARSLTLSSDRLDLIAKLDLVEGDGDSVTPVDYKRGKRPHIASGAYEPEQVQLCVQGMLLEEHGYPCTEGILYYSGSRERVRVVFDEELRAKTRAAIGRQSEMPPLLAGGYLPAG